MYRAGRYALRNRRFYSRRRYEKEGSSAASKTKTNIKKSVNNNNNNASSPFVTFLQGTIGGTFLYGLGHTYETYIVKYTKLPLTVDIGRVFV